MNNICELMQVVFSRSEWRTAIFINLVERVEVRSARASQRTEFCCGVDRPWRCNNKGDKRIAYSRGRYSDALASTPCKTCVCFFVKLYSQPDWLHLLASRPFSSHVLKEAFAVCVCMCRCDLWGRARSWSAPECAPWCRIVNQMETSFSYISKNHSIVVIQVSVSKVVV